MAAVLGGSLLVVAACGREPVAREAPAATATRTLEPSRELAPLITRLNYEAEHRAPGTVTSERVLDALEQVGVSVLARRQYLGVAMRAHYCLGGSTRDGIVIAVCEYPTAEAARAGKAFMDDRFATMSPTAARAAHGTAVLTIAPPDALRQDLVERSFDVFTAL